MTFDDYKNQVREDAIDAISEGDYDDYESFDEVYDALWTDDSVTGNGSGSYTFSTRKAQQNVSDLFWDEEFVDECNGLGIELSSFSEHGPEAMDVTARCLALGYVSSDIEDAWNERRDGNAA